MSDLTASPQATEAEPTEEDASPYGPAFFDQPPGHDWFLVRLIDMANRYGLETGVILTVGGTTVTGQIISGRKFFVEMAEGLAKATITSTDEGAEPTIAEVMSEAFGTYKDVYLEPGDEAWETKTPRAAYIHLRNAKILVPGQPLVPANGLLWRGKLTSIDGVALGTVSNT